MMILQAGFTNKGVRIKIEGVFLDLASVFGSTNGDAPPTVLYGAAKAHSRGRSHQTPGVM
jgi:hypothetical protein